MGLHRLPVLLSQYEPGVEFQKLRCGALRVVRRNRLVELLFPYCYELLDVGFGEFHPAYGIRIDCEEKDAQTLVWCRDTAWCGIWIEAFSLRVRGAGKMSIGWG
jgi:hypothetical protein